MMLLIIITKLEVLTKKLFNVLSEATTTKKKIAPFVHAELKKALYYYELCADMSFNSYYLEEAISFFNNCLDISTALLEVRTEHQVFHWKRLIATSYFLLLREKQAIEYCRAVINQPMILLSYE